MERMRRGSTRTMTWPMSKMMAAGGRGRDIVSNGRVCAGLLFAGAEDADDGGQ
jgi:hypothetical protein